jgi:hypothetical protein
MIEAPRTNHETLMNVLKRTVGDTEAGDRNRGSRRSLRGAEREIEGRTFVDGTFGPHLTPMTGYDPLHGG